MKSSSTASSSAGSRRAFVRYLVAFGAGLGALLGLAEAFLRIYVVPIDDTRANRVSLVYTATGRDAVLGDSHLYRAFINSKAFVNLARAGSSPHALEIVAREYFRFRDPGRVIVEASPQLFNFLMKTRKAQRHDEYFAWNRLGLPFALYVFEPGIRRELALLWKPSELEGLALTSADRKKLTGGIVDSEAAFRRGRSQQELRADANVRVRSNRPVANVRASEGFAAYRRMVEFLVERGASVCLAQTPVDAAYLEIAAEDSRFAEADEAMASLAREFGLTYVDFRDLALDLDVASFTNADHLTTAAGARYAEALEAACYPSPAKGSIR